MKTEELLRNSLANDSKLRLESFSRNEGSDLLCDKLERISGFIDNALIGLYKTDELGAFIYANKKIAQIFGFGSSQAFLDQVPNIEILYANAADRKKLLLHIEKVGIINMAEIEFKRPDGQMIWVNVSGRKIIGDNGIKAYEGFMVDVTDKKMAVDALNESETRFRQLVTQASEAFFLHDFKGNIVDVNQQACESLGFSHEELLSMNVLDIDIDIKDKQHQVKYWEKLDAHEHITFEGTHQRKDGTTFPVEVRLGRIDLKEGRMLLSFSRDISERMRKSEELERAFNEIKQLKDQLEWENRYLRKEIELKYRHKEIIGESHSIKEMLSLAEKVAHQNTCVLITGETGTGKELLAYAIHNMSERNSRPMVKVNCAALPATLIESELFGREKGAYTGALSRRTGRFEAADQSTIFLDEVGDLPIELQAKLLRVLQEGEFERLGSSQTITVDVRIIAATNQDLRKMIQDRKFRKDLYYRLNVFPLTVPPLRKRKADIPLLVWAIINKFSKSMGKQITNISKDTMARLVRYSWPGNVRELKNVIERAMIISSGERLVIDRLESIEEVPNLNTTLNEVEKKHIISTLNDTGWKVSGKGGAAVILGLKPTTLEARMKKLGIKRPVQ